MRELTDELPVSQSAVSQHLRALKNVGLVDVRPEGTRRLYRIGPDGLNSVRAWVDSFWDGALAAFVAHADRAPSADPTVDSDRIGDNR